VLTVDKQQLVATTDDKLDRFEAVEKLVRLFKHW